MHITLSPVAAAERPYFGCEGDALIIGSQRFDFSPLAEGDELPAEAVGSDWIVGPIERVDGAIRLTLRLSHGPSAGQGTLFPAPLASPPDGPLSLPPHGDAEDAQAPEVVTPGAIAWAQLKDADARAAAEIEDRRQRAEIGRGAFALAAFRAGLITRPEALAWAAMQSLPQSVQSVFAQIADEGARLEAEMDALTAPVLRRTNHRILALQAALELTDEQVDALFGIG